MREFNRYLLLFTFLLISQVSLSQTIYSIDLPKENKKIIQGHLDLGGKNPKGDSISVNSYFIELNGKPFFPIVGEFHYCRYPVANWEESILKMKAGGINVIATYVFWNIHERKEGQFDWTGNLNLKHFIELCAKHNIYTIVRLGPFCHGEIRNGGLPDWLYGRPFEVRSNDPEYLFYTKRLYGQIAEQIKEYLFKNGGPIVGVQLENEFQHSAAPWEITYPGSTREYTVANRDINVTHAGVSVSNQKNENANYGKDHMANLKKIANDVGIFAPIYTATGWGNAAIVQKGCIPVTAGYAYPTWEESPRASPFYLFKDIHKNPDYAPVSYEPELYPSIPAELGTGIMVTNLRRPMVLEESIEPLIVRTIGSGSNGIGYYMYHGGSTPSFDHFYSEESTGVPKISYDFQAPIGEFGEIRDHYHSLKLLHLFLESYVDKLAPMQTVLPSTNADITKLDTKTLRYAIRAKGNSGFIFMNNFQDHVELQDINGVQIKINTGNETLSVPNTGKFDLKKGISAILPFNLDLNGLLIKYATVQPLTILNKSGKKHYVFFSNEGFEPEIVIENKNNLKVQTDNCKASKIKDVISVKGLPNSIFSFDIGDKQFLIIPRNMALKTWKSSNNQLYFTDATILENKDRIDLILKGKETTELLVYPATDEPRNIIGAAIVRVTGQSKKMNAYKIEFKPISPELKLEKLTEKKYVLKGNLKADQLNDIIMKIDYKGDRGMAFINGQLVADHFYYGKPWNIGLRRFKGTLEKGEIVFVFHPIYKKYPYLIDFEKKDLPDFSSKDNYLKVGEITFIPEYKATLSK